MLILAGSFSWHLCCYSYRDNGLNSTIQQWYANADGQVENNTNDPDFPLFLSTHAVTVHNLYLSGFFFCPLIFRAVWFSHFLCVSLPHSQSPLCQAQMALPACIAPFNFLPLFIPSSCCCLSPSWLLASTQVGSLPRRITVACITLCTSAERGGGGLDLCHGHFTQQLHSKSERTENMRMGIDRVYFLANHIIIHGLFLVKGGPDTCTNKARWPFFTFRLVWTSKEYIHLSNQEILLPLVIVSGRLIFLNAERIPL